MQKNGKPVGQATGSEGGAGNGYGHDSGSCRALGLANGSTAVIEATPTLSPANWRPVATNIISDGTVRFTDVMTNPVSYYRAWVE